MKKVCLTLVLVCISYCCFAQWTPSGSNAYFNLTGNVGIGTTIPQTKLHVVGGEIRLAGQGTSGVTSTSFVSFYDSNNSTRYGWLGDGSVTNNDITLYADAGNALHFATNGVNDRMFINTSGNVSIGTTDSKGYMFAVNGTAIAVAMTVKLNTNWPDYVFRPDFHLLPLNELKTYIDQNQHLPDMPSQAEVTKNGINLGEMNTLLTKKMEELTLYLLEQEKIQKQQQDRIISQDDRIKKLEMALEKRMKEK